MLPLNITRTCKRFRVRVLVAAAGSVLMAASLAQAQTPVVNSISVWQGGNNGGTALTVYGSNFVNGATVTFGSTAAATTYVGSGTLNVVSPAGTVGSVDVTVRNPNGLTGSLKSFLHNQSFESGITYWTGNGQGTATVGAVTANAHNGTHYLELTSSGAGSHPVVFASNSNGSALYVPVAAGQAISFGGYAYRVSGGSLVRWGIEVTDANKANPIYQSAAPVSAYDPLWTLQQTTYTIPSGKAFVRLYAEIVPSSPTVARFDDGFLQKTTGNSNGFTYLAPPIVTSVSPNWGAPAGGTTRTIYGTGFRSGATVKFGSFAASGVQVVNANAIEVFAPKQSAGAVSVAVTEGNQSGTLASAYTYSNPAAPPSAMLAIKHIIFTFQENRSFDTYFGKMNEYRKIYGITDNAVDERNNS